MRTFAMSRNGKKRPFQVAQTGLKRLPRDFSWMCYLKLFAWLSDELGADSATFGEVARKRDPHLYHALRARYSLQSINCSDERWATTKVACVRLLAETLSKSRDIETVSAADRKTQAIEKSLALDVFRPVVLDRVLEVARREIACLLPPLDMDDVLRSSRHGPGTTVFPRVGTSAYFKYAAYPYSVTPRARSLLWDCVSNDQRWSGALEASYRTVRGIDPWRILPMGELEGETLHSVPYNRIVTVPKDGTKDRTIAIEPVGNVYLQLGVDGVFRRALRRWNIDLDDQRRNQELARIGSTASADWRVRPASLDLSSASDRVSRQLCKELLPKPWFDLLDSLRCPYGLLPDGTGWIYQRMSSMGNGSTFALESLLFAAIIRAIILCFGRKADFEMMAVYGDDCLYPSYLDRHVRVYFEYCGFIVNEAKSFSQGPVRESCGCDYFLGNNVRPVYAPRSWDCAERLLAYRNGLVLWSREQFGEDPPASLIDWLDSYLDVQVGLGPPLSEHRSEYRFSGRCPLTPLFDTMTLSRRSVPVSSGDIGFRKLMHSLASCCSSGGSRFDITERRLGTLVVAKRTVYAYQSVDYPKP